MASTTTMPGNAEIWLTRRQAAWLTGLSARQFDDAVRPLLPATAIRSKKNDLSFNAQAIAAALVSYRVAQVKPTDDALMLGASDSGSEWLEPFRKEQTLLKRLERMEKEKTLVSIVVLDSAFNRFASHIRGAGEILQRRWGNEASDIINKAIDEAIAGWDIDRSRHDSAAIDSGGSSDQEHRGQGESTPDPDDAPVRRGRNRPTLRASQG